MSFFDSDDFKPLERIAGRAVITVTKNGVSFSKQAVSKLSYTHYVQIFISQSKKILGVKACDKNSTNSIKFVNEEKQKVDYVRWNNADFTKEINSIATEEAVKEGYKVEGDYLQDENALIFNFNNLEIIKK